MRCIATFGCPFNILRRFPNELARSMTTGKSGIIGVVVGDIEKGLCARFIVAREMSVLGEALRVEDDLGGSVGVQACGHRRHSFGHLRRHARGRRDDADP